MALTLSRRSLIASAGLLACRGALNDPQRPENQTVRLSSGVSLFTVRSGARRSPVRWLLHGGPGLDHTYLRPSMEPLREQAQLRYIDLRGHGLSSAPPAAVGYALDAAADDLAELATRLQERNIDLVGHDFGAAVALLAAARHPGLVRSLVLVAPLKSGQQLRAVGARSRELLGVEGWRTIQNLTTPQGTLRDPHALATLFRALGPMWWSRPPSDETLRSLTQTMRYRPEADANFLQAANRFDAMLWVSRVRCPALVVAGADDRTFLEDECRSLADALPHGQMVTLARAGHLPFVEQPAEFRAALGRFWGARREG